MSLPKLTPHVAHLTTDTWLISEGRQQRRPMQAISGFDHRNALHLPVKANLHIFQDHAERLPPYLPHMLDAILQRRLDSLNEDRSGPAPVRDIPKAG